MAGKPKAGKTWVRKPKPKKVVRRKRVPAPAPAKKKKSVGRRTKMHSVASLVAAVDATQRVHVPPPLPMGPYTLIRSRTTMEINAIQNDNTVYLFGAHGSISTAQSNINSCLCVYGVGAGVPGVAEYYKYDPVVLPYASLSGNAMASLHALTVSVNCTASATTTTGSVYVGVLNQRIRRFNYTTWTAVADALKARPEIVSHSALGSAAGIKVSDFPVDVVDWCAQHALLGAVEGTDMITKDSLGQVVVIFGPTGTATNIPYTITIHAEWRINFTDVALASTARKHAVSPSSIWDSIMALGASNGGYFPSLQTAGEFIGLAKQAYEPLQGMYNMARTAMPASWMPKALPAISSGGGYVRADGG